MELGIRQGDTVKVTVEGEDEYAAAVKLKAFFGRIFSFMPHDRSIEI
ncbi:MAG: HPr family phosphocarrier protein [Clostridia bacterium]|nr:HPr family phosphocarrier protein [Clostridia bacterium]